MSSTSYTFPVVSAKPSWSQRLALAFAYLAVPAILLGTTQLLSREFDRGERLRAAVDQSYQARWQLKAVLSTHQDIETGQRGYIITGDQRFLEPNVLAVARISRDLANLDRSLAEYSSLQSRLERLRELSREKLRFTSRTIALREQGRTEDAEALIASGEGKRMMDEIRRIIAALDAMERREIKQRLAQSNAVSAAARKMSVALQVGLLLLLAAAMFLNHRTAAARRRTLRAVHDLGARQAAILDSAKDGIIILNPSGSIENLNPAAARMYGYAPEELIRRDVGVLFEVAPDRGQVETFLKRMQRRRQSDDGVVQEFQGKRRDGSTFASDVAISAVPLADGMRYVAIVRDISDRKHMEQMKDDFVSTVSHELRTPLTSIAGSLGLLTGGAGGPIPERALRLITIAKNNSERLVRLINDILDVEKISAGHMQFDVKPVELRPLLNLLVEANLGFAAQHEVSLALGEVPDAWVMADPDRLAQVITNLLSNAIKFSPPRERVEVSVEPLDQRYRISIADRGSGIPEEFRHRIFSRFAQADTTDTREKGGTGLGLSIVKEIVNRLGGSVSFKARAGGGTVFHVDLPAPAAERRAPRERQPEDTNLPLVLHVDDDPDTLALVSDAFAQKARVIAAASLSSARSALAGQSFDLVVLDIALPDGIGLDLICDTGMIGDVPVIIYSAQDAPGCRGAPVLVKSQASLESLVDTSLRLIADRRRERKAA